MLYRRRRLILHDQQQCMYDRDATDQWRFNDDRTRLYVHEVPPLSIDIRLLYSDKSEIETITSCGG